MQMYAVFVFILSLLIGAFSETELPPAFDYFKGLYVVLPTSQLNRSQYNYITNSFPRTITSPMLSKEVQYAYFTESIVDGMRNVRWETMPHNYVDATGGSMVAGCYDDKGRKRENGEEYQRPDKKFFYRCTNNIEEVVSCVGSDRTKRARIKVGQTLEVEGFWHKCRSFPNGSVIYTEEDACIRNGNNIHIGEEILMGYFRLRCLDAGYIAVGCYYTDDNSKNVLMEIENTKLAGRFAHHCVEIGDEIVHFTTAAFCTQNGKVYIEGEVFKENHLHYKCEDGVVNIKGCYIDDKLDIEVGKDVVDPNHMVYRCYRHGETVIYEAYLCGDKDGRSCEPEYIESEDPIEFIMRGSAYYSITIMQEINKVISPETIKLYLDNIFMKYKAHAFPRTTKSKTWPEDMQMGISGTTSISHYKFSNDTFSHASTILDKY